ncbi:hypothetical protein [Nocardioides sp. zg-1228]|uniref:hypothetical protein n=1 Tax=Nocardioides sp. zg-1228 TaxID=2763008 RepID=UPI0016424275|nr:hypothetical protein [Nocardioides sp. zg-1228]MBC2931412.1 hypothetical protein [Nocardioides sp. zg-1228]QSF57028.1 hypothetical protein JX575_15820 [Nocardioides sp. zg-1228]
MGVHVEPITSRDLPEVGRFLHQHLNARVAPQQWVEALAVPWLVDQPNHGYHLRQDGQVVGAYLAYYSDRVVGGSVERFCNLGAWCVLEGHRHRGTRLLTRLLAQEGYHFTDFSPSGNVVPLNRKLHFADLDTTTDLVPNLPATPRNGVRVSSDAQDLLETLTPAELDRYRDHVRAAAAKHLLVSTPREHCHVVFRHDRRKNVRAFGTILHVSNPDLFRTAAGQVAGHLLTRHRIPMTLVEHRVAGGSVRHGRQLARPRPKMFRSPTLAPEHIDYLYSELTCLAW